MSKIKSIANKMLVLLLCLVFACSAFSGCKQNSTTSKNDNRVSYTDGTHIFNTTESQTDFIKNGATDYKLVLPQNAGTVLNTAKQEFIYFLNLATGISISSVLDNDITHDASQKYISLGDTKLLESANIDIDREELGIEGYRIITKDNNVYIVGGYYDGVVYGVYKFFNIMFNYEFFYWNCYQIDKGVKNLKLKNFDVIDIPDIGHLGSYSYRQQLYPRFPDNYDSQMLRWREKSPNYHETYIIGGFEAFDKSSKESSNHNVSEIIPASVYGDHEKWFSNNGNGQLCLTARGDKAEFEALALEVAKKATFGIWVYKQNPYKNVFAFTSEDNYDTCSCSECSRLANYYGTEAGAVCIFINRVAEHVENWMNGNVDYETWFPESANIVDEFGNAFNYKAWLDKNPQYEKKDFRVIFMAYNNWIDAPVKWSARENKYVAFDNNVKLRHNVGVWLADIEMDYQRPIYSEEQESVRKNISGWANLTDCMYYYSYAVCFEGANYLYDSFGYWNSDTWQYMAEYGARLVFVEHFGGESTWARLKLFLMTELRWDTTLDMEMLLDKYFDAMFGVAAPIMREMFDSERAHIIKTFNEYDMYGDNSVFKEIKKDELWPEPIVKHWMNLCEQALVSIEKYKNDEDLYNQIREHIEVEWISPAYIYLRHYGKKMQISDKNELKQRLLDLHAALNCENYTVEHMGTNIITDINSR